MSSISASVELPGQHLYPFLEKPHQIIHAQLSEIETLLRWKLFSNSLVPRYLVELTFTL